MDAGWSTDPAANDNLASVQGLPVDVTIEDTGCTEKGCLGPIAGLSAPGPLNHLERPDFEFATCIAARIPD